MKIGFIGLGMMGSGIVANLQKAGHDLVVHDLRRAAAEPYLAKGAEWADTPRAVAEAADVIFTSLPGPPEVEEVALGENGLLSGMSRGKAYFDLSTNSPVMVRKIHAAFAERDAYMLDSPVSGGPRGAASGRLALWVGGDEQIFNRFKTVLDAMGDKARYVGPIGAGSIAKLVHNGAGYCIQTALAEMFSVGVKAGVEPLALWEAVRDGALGRRRTFDGLVDQFLPGKYEPAAFALRLAHKDVSLATQLGRDFGVPMRVANLALAELTEGLNRGWGARDSRSPMLLQLERAGVEIKVTPERIKEALEREQGREQGLEDLNLSRQTTDALKNAGLKLVGDLVQKTEADLLRTPNFGRHGLNEVTEALARLGLHLAT
jgi:3-hydroxyisobutyrate dehydrogenase-like beta-hydroxyacid dehydrogenase